MEDSKSKIQKTASTLIDLKDHSDVAFCSEIAELMEEKISSGWPKIFSNNFSAFPVARFCTMQAFLEFMSERLGPQVQIVELGAGFTPHFLNLKAKVSKYIEVDLPVNSNLKKEIINEVYPDSNVVYVSGDISEVTTWDEIKKHINMSSPVIVFSEGVIAQYFSSEQKQKIATYVKDILSTEGSCFVLDDTLRNHPELQTNPIIEEGMQMVTKASGNNVYKSEPQSFPEEVQRWSKLLEGKELITIDYVLSKPEMDFAVNNFKLIICMTRPNELIKAGLAEMSRDNKKIRVWKN
jgi:O-methyltransferase involved in polyketide biosynthesis